MSSNDPEAGQAVKAAMRTGGSNVYRKIARFFVNSSARATLGAEVEDVVESVVEFLMKTRKSVVDITESLK